MDRYLFEADGTLREYLGICGADPGPLGVDDPKWPVQRPCRLPETHIGPHESKVARTVHDTLRWNTPPMALFAAPDGAPRVDEDTCPHGHGGFLREQCEKCQAIKDDAKTGGSA